MRPSKSPMVATGVPVAVTEGSESAVTGEEASPRSPASVTARTA